TPGASDDFTDTDAGTPVTISVLDNDVAPPGGRLGVRTLTVIVPAKHGTVAIHPAAGTLTYTANLGFTGTDTFRYSVLAGVPAGSGTTRVPLRATVGVHVNRPVAADDWTDTDGTTPVTIDVLDNDQDPDGHEHIEPALHTGASVALVTRPAHGRVTLNAD